MRHQARAVFFARLVEGFSLDFGIIRGFHGASPQVALQLGFSLDF